LWNRPSFFSGLFTGRVQTVVPKRGKPERSRPSQAKRREEVSTSSSSLWAWSDAASKSTIAPLIIGMSCAMVVDPGYRRPWITVTMLTLGLIGGIARFWMWE
jgi:hypothetical protein